MNLDNSFEEQGNWEDGGFPCYVRVYYTVILNITVERYHILYFVLQGVQTQSPEIRISLGGSALPSNHQYPLLSHRTT